MVKRRCGQLQWCDAVRSFALVHPPPVGKNGEFRMRSTRNGLHNKAWGRRPAAHPRWLMRVNPNPNGVPHRPLMDDMRTLSVKRCAWCGTPSGFAPFSGALTWGAPLPRRPQALLCDPVGVNRNAGDPVGVNHNGATPLG